jgi:Bacterial regulatory proteins, crp family
MTREDIANATGMSLGSISTYLSDLRKAKLVDNQNRMWRRRAPPPVNETMLVAAPRLDNLNGIADGHAHNA